jgi:hypothetical protein
LLRGSQDVKYNKSIFKKLKKAHKMKQVLFSFLNHKDLYTISLTLGSATAFILDLLINFYEKTVFGLSLSLWLIALVINIIDIHTGIKADSERKKRLGEKFIFVSKKGWRAFEKILVFTLIIWFVYSMELEVLRLDMWSGFTGFLLGIKLILLIYVVLIELQSIGENEEARFGQKSKVFALLDRIIEAVNEGILNKLQKLLNK